MAVSRAERRREWTPRAIALFGEDRAPFALDLLELIELAWHDCYGEVTPPEGVIEDMLLLSEGSIERLIQLTPTRRRGLAGPQSCGGRIPQPHIAGIHFLSVLFRDVPLRPTR